MSRFSHRPHVDNAGRGDERGAIIPMVALSMLTILLIATLVVDGSQAYPVRRKVQNAADAAALAGTQQLDKAKWFTPDPLAQVAATRAIYTKALAVARDNAGAGTTIDCTFIDANGNPVVSALGTASCNEDPTGTLVVPSAAQGVRIVASAARANTFGNLAGSSSVTARAKAAATVQKVNTTGSPFIVCANPSPKLAPPPGTIGWDLLKTDPEFITDWSVYDRPWDPPFIFNPDGSVDFDPNKVAAANASNGGKGIALVGSEPRVPRCGVSGGNFDGNGSMNVVQIPSWVTYENGGGHSEAAAEQVASATPCPDPLPSSYDANANPCDMILPIAIDGSSDTDQLRVVAMAVFRISGNGLGNPKYYGKINAQIRYVAGGRTSIDPVTAESLRVVRLIE